MKNLKLITLVLILAVSLVVSGCASPASTTPASTTPAKTESPAAQEPAKQQPQAPETDVVADSAKAYFANLPGHIYKISEKEFVDKVKAGEDMFVMDIRQPNVYAEGHIKGAVNIPWGEAIAQNLVKLPKDKPIFVYCYTGQTAGQTVALLNVAGFNARSVNLGWNLGISKVEGVADVTETTANPISTATTNVDEKIQKAISDYFANMAVLKGTTYANYKISEDDAKKLVDAKDSSIQVLSIRKAEDFAKGHIEGAINIPYGKGMTDSFEQLPKDKKIIVYCYTGQTAGQTVTILRLLGYDAVSLNSGMGMASTGKTGWANKGFPVVQ